MKVINKQNISLKTISEATDTQSPKCEITIEGTKIKKIINGVDIELCVRYKDYCIVFTTDDCPFEESLNVYLLSQDNRIIDNATIFWPYGTGSFSLLNLTEPNLVFFKFFDSKVWKIEIFENRRFFLPYISEPSGVWRKLKFRRNFKITEIPFLESTVKI